MTLTMGVAVMAVLLPLLLSAKKPQAASRLGGQRRGELSSVPKVGKV